MSDTSIQWTDKTWNPVTGCTKVSEGCRHCYAETVAKRFWKDRKFTDVLCHEDRLEQPLRWRKASKVFVNSMSDLFHEDVPFDFIDQVFAVMALTPQHTYQILTKRPERMREYLSDSTLYRRLLDCADQGPRRSNPRLTSIGISNPTRFPYRHVWLGVSVEDQKTADERIPLLLQTPAAVRFVSYEPALAPVDFGLSIPLTNADGTKGKPIRVIDYFSTEPKIHWAIVGGESGIGARPFNVQWARSMIAQCKAAGVACFVKQLGKDPYEAPEGVTPNTSGPDAVKCRYIELDIDKGHGGNMVEWPEDLRVREFPS